MKFIILKRRRTTTLMMVMLILLLVMITTTMRIGRILMQKRTVTPMTIFIDEEYEDAVDTVDEDVADDETYIVSTHVRMNVPIYNSRYNLHNNYYSVNNYANNRSERWERPWKRYFD